MKIGETKSNVTYTIKIKELKLQTNDSYDVLLDKIENAPKIIDNLQGYRTTVDHMK